MHLIETKENNIVFKTHKSKKENFFSKIISLLLVFFLNVLTIILNPVVLKLCLKSKRPLKN